MAACFDFLSQFATRVCGSLPSGAPSKDHKNQLCAAKKDLLALIDRENCNPILVRLAWHDSGTFDQRIPSFPARGGANGAIIHKGEINFGANAGLSKAVNYLRPIKEKYPLVSWADLIQMASAVAVEHAGGPAIPIRYGRVDVSGPEDCVASESREGFSENAGLPDAKPPFSCGSKDPAMHLRNVFTKKLGFVDQEIVALSGAHTIGRAFADRSGTCPYGYTNPTKYTGLCPHLARADGKEGFGMKGGQSWTKNWLKFDNEYFQYYTNGSDKPGSELLWFPTDHALYADPAFKPTFEAYAKDQALFFKDYAAAHKKLSELGSKWQYGQGFTIES